jgi:hypothetical protein
MTRAIDSAALLVGPRLRFNARCGRVHHEAPWTELRGRSQPVLVVIGDHTRRGNVLVDIQADDATRLMADETFAQPTCLSRRVGGGPTPKEV